MKTLLAAEGPSRECELVEAALGSRTFAERTALVNELLGDWAAAIDWGVRIPLTAARLSVLGPLSTVFFVLAFGGAATFDIVPIIAWGGAGVLASLAAGREADRVVAETRRGIDGWVERVLGAAGDPGSR